MLTIYSNTDMINLAPNIGPHANTCAGNTCIGNKGGQRFKQYAPLSAEKISHAALLLYLNCRNSAMGLNVRIFMRTRVFGHLPTPLCAFIFWSLSM